jgi:glycosyltransferase involved in cell wall biosynthesis
MATTHPQVTVLLPVRNGAAHLQAAINSILAQTLVDFELLVIDDGSTDASPEILRAVRDPRLRVVTHPQNIGLVPTLNEGLELARGEFVARQDHDDRSHPARLQKQVDYLRAHADCALVGTEALQTDEEGRIAFRLLRPLRAESVRWYLCFDNAFIHSTVMFRRELIRSEFGGYTPSFHSEDYALWSRVACARPTANLPEPLLYFREHAGSITGSMSGAQEAAFDEATGAIRRQNLDMLFGSRATPEDTRILTTYRRDFNAASAGAFLRVFDRLAREFASEVKDTGEFRRVQAIQLAELAYRLLPMARWPALGLYRRALALHPALAPLLPWMRIVALMFLGQGARSLYRRLFLRGKALESPRSDS